MRRRDAIEKAPCSSEPWAEEIFPQKLRCSCLHREKGRPRKGERIASFHLWNCVFVLFLLSHADNGKYKRTSNTHLSFAFVLVARCANILTNCIMPVISPPFLSSSLPPFSHFTLMLVNSPTGFFRVLSGPLPLPGSLAQTPVACDWHMRLGHCVLTLAHHWSQGWAALIGHPLCGRSDTLRCSHMHVSYPSLIFSHQVSTVAPVIGRKRGCTEGGNPVMPRDAFCGQSSLQCLPFLNFFVFCIGRGYMLKDM